MPPAPAGFRCEAEFITEDEERALIEDIAKLPLQPYRHEVDGKVYEGKRRVYNYGLSAQAGEQNEPFPDWLIPLRDKAASWAGHAGEDLVQAHLIEYSPGTPIGWHRDAPPYKEVIGISLNNPCRFILRRRTGKGAFDKFETIAEPRSIYLLSGPARSEWEHGIPPVKDLRYSITFRTLPK